MEHENDILTITRDTETERQIKQNYSYEKITPSANPQVQNSYRAFDDYSHSPREKDYEEFEVVHTYAPRKKPKQDTAFADFVSEQNSYSPSKETFLYEKVKPQKKAKKTSKIFVAVCCSVAVLMGTLGIINTVKMNNLSFSNVSNSEKIANLGSEIQKIDQAIEGMVSETTIKENAQNQGMEEITTETTIPLNEIKNVEKHQGRTNLFDKICNFFRSLFGG